MGLSFVYSEQVMNALYVSSDEQLRILYRSNCNGDFCLKHISELEKLDQFTIRVVFIITHKF
jgi:hypothetical protein